MNESSCCSTSSPVFGFVSVPDFDHSNRCIVLYHCCLNLHFLMVYDVEHLFTFLFVICISSLVRCLLRSLARFLTGLFVFLLLSFKSSSYILDNNPLSDVSLASIFSQSVACGLILLTLSLTEQNFSFNEIQFISYFFHGLCLWCYI